jgi:hypothetical protein
MHEGIDNAWAARFDDPTLREHGSVATILPMAIQIFRGEGTRFIYRLQKPN